MNRWKKDKRNTEIWKMYIKQFWILAFIAVFFCCMQAIVFYLYNVESEPVLYSMGICSFFSIVFIISHYLWYKRRHLERMHIKDHILYIEDFQAPRTLSEADYIDILKKLKKEYASLQTKLQNERKDSIDYYTTWVHQIKTPIAVMRMIIQSEDTDVNRALGAELFRIEQYVEMVLCYFRLDSNSSDFIFNIYDLDQIIRQAIRKYAAQFIQRKIKLQYTGSDKQVLTDEKWLLFILEQLLSNAVKYTPTGSVTIDVTEDSKVMIRDTGIGIAPEDIPRVFEKGYTGYNGRADKKSTGLGLYLCMQATKKLNNHIKIESRAGIGTTVILDLYRESHQVE